MIADRVLLRLRRIAVRLHPQMLAGVQIDRGDAADRSLEQRREAGERIARCRSAPRRLGPRHRRRRHRQAHHRRRRRRGRFGWMPAFFAASGYISVAALTDSAGQPALVATQADDRRSGLSEAVELASGDDRRDCRRRYATECR